MPPPKLSSASAISGPKGLNREIEQAADAIGVLEREAEERLARVRQMEADLVAARA